jgi:hypothetical protein
VEDGSKSPCHGGRGRIQDERWEWLTPDQVLRTHDILEANEANLHTNKQHALKSNSAKMRRAQGPVGSREGEDLVEDEVRANLCMAMCTPQGRDKVWQKCSMSLYQRRTFRRHVDIL